MPGDADRSPHREERTCLHVEMCPPCAENASRLERFRRGRARGPNKAVAGPYATENPAVRTRTGTRLTVRLHRRSPQKEKEARALLLIARSAADLFRRAGPIVHSRRRCLSTIQPPGNAADNRWRAKPYIARLNIKVNLEIVRGPRRLASATDSYTTRSAWRFGSSVCTTIAQFGQWKE